MTRISNARSYETAEYERVKAMPLTKVHGKPTRQARVLMHEECMETSATADVSYEWAEEHGLLAEFTPADTYADDTGFNYVEPVRPPRVHPDIAEDTIDFNRKRLEAENEEDKVNWHIRQ